MQELLAFFQPGKSVYLPGASGEIASLAAALAADPGRMRGVQLVSCLLPGVNGFDYAALDPTASVTTFLLPPALRPSFMEGRIDLLPMAYSEIAAYLGGRRTIDVAVAHVAPSGPDGRCSLGIAADFTPLAWTKAGKRVLVINHAMPNMARGPRLALSDADAVVEIDDPLTQAASSQPSPTLDTIARAVSDIIPDGATLQVGIGGAPGAVWRHLTGHRDLTLASGLVSEDFLTLAAAGSLRDGTEHLAGVAFGPIDFYHALAQCDLVRFASVNETHDILAIGRHDRFTAVNSALEVDLFGQANLEWQGGRLSSGVGGAPDFARGAARSAGGRSIVALPATAKAGQVSRIVARIDAPTISIGRTDIDTVVTEYGVADLRDRSIDSRARALIAIADPQWRETLAAQWSAIRSGF